MIDEEKAKAEEAAQEELEQKLERLEGNLGNIRFASFYRTQWSVDSGGHKLSENIWFVWSKP